RRRGPRVRGLGRDQPRRRRQPWIARQRLLPQPYRLRRLLPGPAGEESPMDASRSRPRHSRALRRRRREAAGMTPVQTAKRIGRGTLKSENWVQLFQFGIVGASGYFANLGVFAVLVGPANIHHIPAAILA